MEEIAEVVPHPILFYFFDIGAMISESYNKYCKLFKKSIFALFRNADKYYADEVHKAIHRWQYFVVSSNSIHFWPDIM